MLKEQISFEHDCKFKYNASNNNAKLYINNNAKLIQNH